MNKAAAGVCVLSETSLDGKQVLKKRFVALCKLLARSLSWLCSARGGGEENSILILLDGKEAK